MLKAFSEVWREGHYRASTEEGQRLLDNITTSLDKAHQEQQQASAQFQQADTYRKMSNISEEQAATINSNATQEFMNDLQQKGHDTRSIEKTMVDHPQEAQKLADEFVQEKVKKYFDEFHQADNSSVQKIEESNQINEQVLNQGEKNEKPEVFYHQEHEKIKSKAHEVGLEKKDIIDKKPVETTEKLIAEKTRTLTENQPKIEQANETINHQIKEHQKEIRKSTALPYTKINQLNSGQD